MRIAEQVTFGGSGMDRRAELRCNPDAMAELRNSPDAMTILFWRGRAFLEDGALKQVPFNHFVTAGRESIFLAEAPQPLFAIQLADWDGAPAGGDIGPGLAFTDLVAHPDLPGTGGFVDLRVVMAELSPMQAELAAMGRAMLEWHRFHKFCSTCGAASKIDQGGWRRICPACGRAHFPRTDPVVIMLVTHGNSVLLGRGAGWPDQMYSLLAGYVEPGETIEAAVRREVREEAGIRCGEVCYLASQPWPFPSSLMIGCRTEALDTAITCDPVELADALWIRREEVAEVLAGRDTRISPSKKGSIARFLLESWVADRLD